MRAPNLYHPSVTADDEKMRVEILLTSQSWDATPLVRRVLQVKRELDGERGTRSQLDAPKATAPAFNFARSRIFRLPRDKYHVPFVIITLRANAETGVLILRINIYATPAVSGSTIARRTFNESPRNTLTLGRQYVERRVTR